MEVNVCRIMSKEEDVDYGFVTINKSVKYSRVVGPGALDLLPYIRTDSENSCTRSVC